MKQFLMDFLDTAVYRVLKKIKKNKKEPYVKG